MIFAAYCDQYFKVSAFHRTLNNATLDYRKVFWYLVTSPLRLATMRISDVQSYFITFVQIQILIGGETPVPCNKSGFFNGQTQVSTSL